MINDNLDKYIFIKLRKKYPDLVIKNFAKDHFDLYQLVRNTAKNKSLTIESYLSQLGFNYEKMNKIIVSSFDVDCVRKMIEEFNFTQSELANWLGISRQAVNEKIKNKIKNGNWEHNTLTDKEIEIIHSMVKDHKYTFNEEDIVIAIRNNLKENCIFIKDNENIKVIFDIPEEIKNILINNNYHILGEVDINIKNNLIPVTVLGRKLAKIAPSKNYKKIYQQINKQCKKRNITINDYFKLLGYEDFCDARILTDDEIIEIIKKYVFKENFVVIPYDSEDYNGLVNRAQRANMTLDEFLEFFGFIKINNRSEANYIKKIEEYKQQLKSYEIGNSKKIYLNTETLLYKKLYSFAKRRGISVDKLLHQLGYERIYNRNELQFESFYYNTIKEDTQKILNELEQIQGTLDKNETKTSKIARSKKLVSKLKQLYSYRCQLCSSDGTGIPLIERLDGTYYVEVHHIKALAYANEMESHMDNDDFLDTYINAIVVCPFHHKVLHYHHGGFEEIISKDNELYFVSKKGSLLKIITNYHLSPTKRE